MAKIAGFLVTKNAVFQMAIDTCGTPHHIAIEFWT